MKHEETENTLRDLERQGALRELKEMSVRGKYITAGGRTFLNLSSNDYLGLTEDNSPHGLGPGGAELQREFFRLLGEERTFIMSNPSSRLMTGNNAEYALLENSLAALYPGGRKALATGSGFSANAGVIPAITEKGDLIVADKASHASIIDGLKLSGADHLRFRHNDMGHLEDIVRKNRSRYRNVWVATESVFSMDGDRCPLEDIVGLKRRYDLRLMLDEAHSFGVYGPRGAGCAAMLGLSEEIDVLIGTLSKAVASTGGFIIADEPLVRLMANHMRTLIFSTALPSVNLLWSDFLVGRLESFEPRRRHLAALCDALTGRADSASIIPVMAPGNANALRLADEFRHEGFWATAIRQPTVPEGGERLRISLTASMSMDEVESVKALCRRLDVKPGLQR